MAMAEASTTMAKPVESVRRLRKAVAATAGQSRSSMNSAARTMLA